MLIILKVVYASSELFSHVLFKGIVLKPNITKTLQKYSSVVPYGVVTGSITVRTEPTLNQTKENCCIVQTSLSFNGRFTSNNVSVAL